MHPRLQKLFLLLTDLIAQALAFLLGAQALALYGKYPSIASLEGWWNTTGEIHTLVHIFFVFLVLVRFYIKGLYSRRIPFWDELRLILGTLIYLAILNGVFVLIAKWPFSRVLWLVSWCLACILIPLARALTRRLLQKLKAWDRPTIIIGAQETAYLTFRALKSEPGLGYKLTEFVSWTAPSPEITQENLPVTTVQRNELMSYLLSLSQDEPHLQVIVALEQNQTLEAQNLVETLGLHFSDLHLVPALTGLPIFGMEMNHFFSHEVLLLRAKNNLSFRPTIFAKRVFDITVALALMVLLLPLLLWIAARIRKSGPGVLFVQPRVGHLGNTFYCFKFRTMVPDAEKILKELLSKDPLAKKEWEEKTKITNDPRITPIGHFLRKTSLDELPQLLNVLKGEMSLVGPRPILLHEVDKYGPRLMFYKNAKPGITGLWQVSGRSNTEYSYRVHLDAWYVKNWSLWYDIAILFKTVRVVLKREGAY